MNSSVAGVERTTPLGHRIFVFPSPDALLDEMATRFIEVVKSLPVGARVVLAGGTTPLPLYERVASRGRAGRWNDVWFLTSDERCVPPDHPDSNFGRISKVLLRPLGVKDDRIVRFLGERPPERAAEIMHRELIDLGQRVPCFDLVLLGLGADGHTASLFPAQAWPDFGVRLAAAVRHPEGSDRITLTPPALRSSARTWFLVSGREKMNAVRDTLSVTEPSPAHPASMVTGRETEWFLDVEAASGLADVS